MIKLILLLAAIGAINAQDHRHGYSDQDYEDDDDHLLTKINCKVGEKYEYAMATQSSLFSHDNLQMRVKVELLCQSKPKWLNKTSGQFLNAQLFEARIVTIRPTLVNDSQSESSASMKNGKLQMSALFAHLATIPDAPKTNGKLLNQPNLKVGAVNHFFEDLSRKIGLFFQELYHKFIRWLEGVIKKRPANDFRARESEQSGWKTFNWNLKCSNNKTEWEKLQDSPKRSKRDTTYRYVNYEPVEDRLDQLYRHPFTFVQLDDGSVQSVKISELDKDANVIHFKKFLAHAFSTQLDDRKKEVIESDHLGEYKSHYQMEYDEPERARITPDQYIRDVYKRAKRDTQHLVSVVRSVRQKDFIKKNDNHYRNKLLCLADIDFSAQQVQLIENNMLVASGGHFRSVFPFASHGNSRIVKRQTISSESQDFDKSLSSFMNLEMEYSMVKLKSKWKRSLEDESRVVRQYEHKLQTMLARFSAHEDETFDARIFRSKRDTKLGEQVGDNNNSNSNLVCISHGETDNEIESDSASVPSRRKCYEYKEFGSSLIKISINKTITTGQRKAKSLESFETQYKTVAHMLGQELVVGKVEITRNGNKSRVGINFLGSQYLDLNLCEVKDRDFFISNSIPLFSENIWFLTDVGIKLKYYLNFRFNVPDSVCKNMQVVADAAKPDLQSNEITLARMMEDGVEMKQNTRLEFGGLFDASFMIFNGAMKLSGKFDMDNFVNFGESCLSAKSHVKPMKVSLDFNYKFFHPICAEWVEDTWIPKKLTWSLNKDYRNDWLQQACL